MNTVSSDEKKAKNSERVCNRDKCTGCGACSMVCPLNCIQMITDAEGFYYPEIDTNRCIECNKCRKTCPSLAITDSNDSYLTEAFAFINKNDQILARSTSGGFFSAIAEWVFRHNGIVYGCQYDNSFNAIFCKAETMEEIVAMRGSKYVESKAWPIFSEIKQSLENDRIVMFIGLPCQIGGLLSVLGDKAKKNLITVDILCHGVPSHKLFEAYLKQLTTEKGPILEYHFRNKKYWGWGSWGTYLFNAHGKSKEQKLLAENDYYYCLYFKENNYRESCYRCKYASLPRISDITVGDCWSIEEIDSTIDSKVGVSLILLNSNKGKHIFDDIKCLHSTRQISVEDAIKYNKTITTPATRPEQRDEFYLRFNQLGFKNTAARYCKLKHVMPVIARYLPRNLKKSVKRLIKKGVAR